MAWWIWGFICWAAISTLALIWLAAVCWQRRLRTRRGEPPSDLGPIPGLGEESPGGTTLPAATLAEAPVQAHLACTGPTSSPGRTTQPLAGPPPGAERRGLVAVEVEQRLLNGLVEGARTGDYTLPERLTELHRTVQHLRDLHVPAPAHVGRDEAVGRLVRGASESGPLEPMALCAEMHRARTDRLLFQEALDILSEATRRAEDAAVREAAERSDAVIVEHLRPAFREVLQRAGDVARTLGRHLDDGFRPDTPRIITASRRVRNAYLALPELVRRHSSILFARDVVNALGQRTAQCDQRGLFSLLENPGAFAEEGATYEEISAPPLPEDDTARLLWLVSDAAKAGRPWLPTVAEQDAAWRTHFDRSAPAVPLATSE